MDKFEEAATLKRPDEITKSRFINPENQINKKDAQKLAENYNIVWGVK